MRVNTSGDNNGKITVLDGRFLYRREKVFEFVRFKVYVLDLKSEMAPCQGSFEDNSVRPVVDPLPSFAYKFKGPR